MIAHQRLSQGWGLIGYEIEYVDPESGNSATGLVSSVKLEDGQLYAEVENGEVSLGWITRVSTPSEKESDEE